MILSKRILLGGGGGRGTGGRGIRCSSLSEPTQKERVTLKL